MIDTTVHQSKICAPSSAFILGQVSSDLNAFSKLESSDIVRSLFGIGETNPNAMDITEALVQTIDPDDQFKARALLQDRGTAGVIWRFTSSKKFMVELSKAFTSRGNFLTLTLVMMNDSTSINARELVRFSKDGTTFMDRHMKSLEYNTEAVDTLQKIHDDAIAKLEEKYLKPEEPKKEEVKPVEPSPAPVKKDLCHFDITGLEQFGDKEVELCSKIWDPLGKLIENGMTDCDQILQWLVESQLLEMDKYSFSYAIEHKDDDSTRGLYHIIVTVNEVKEEPPTKKDFVILADCTPYTLDPNHWLNWDEVINAMDIGCEITENKVLRIGDSYHVYHNAAFHELIKEGDVAELNEKYRKIDEEKAKQGQDVDGDQPMPPELKEEMKDMGISDSDIKAVEDGKVSAKEVIKLHEAEEELKEDWSQEEPGAPNEPITTQITPDSNPNPETLPPADPDDYQEEAQPKPPAPEHSYTYNIIINGHEKVEIADQVRAFVAEGIQSVANGGAPFNVKNEIMSHFNTTVDDVQFNRVNEFQTDITITLQEVVKQEPVKEQAMPKYKIELTEALKDIEETIKVELTKLLDDGCDNCTDLTSELIKITEMDHLCVTHNAETDVYFVGEEAPAEEVPGADIHDPEVQAGLMRGVFGVVDPAITHIQTFLRRHLKEIGNAGYLATETFPTEVMQVWNEKPYNFTLSIVKFKDGRFYRIFLAVTNPGLPDQTWLATNDVPGRWIQIGRDIAQGEYRPHFQRPNRRY